MPKATVAPSLTNANVMLSLNELNKRFYKPVAYDTVENTAKFVEMCPSLCK